MGNKLRTGGGEFWNWKGQRLNKWNGPRKCESNKSNKIRAVVGEGKE